MIIGGIMEKKNKKGLFLVGIALLLILVGLGFVERHYNRVSAFFSCRAQKAVIAQEPEEWLTVFVHGTFGCLLGLLSLPAVINDDVGSSLYKVLVSAQRKDPSNYLDQAILQRGLVKIQPTYDLRVTNGQRLSAFPLARAFQDFAEYGKKNKSHTTFYTFGWNGLLSQKQRRIESVRFYNALVEEIERYRKVGKNPKVRLVAHSHGGNLCLNLAAINDLLSLSSYQDVAHVTSDAATNDALLAMFDYIKKLSSKEDVAHAKKLKRLDHVPTCKLTIDELVLLGTPVQVETEPFFFSPAIKKIYHFYSDEDAVQPLDFVSTKGKSMRKIKRIVDAMPKIQVFPELMQSRIVINRQMNHKIKKQKKHHKKRNCCEYAVTHRDLWGVAWRKSDNPLAPLPIFVLTPLLIDVLNAQASLCHDADINIKFTAKYLKVQATPHNVNEVNAAAKIPRRVFDEIQKNVGRWNPYCRSAR